MTRFGISVVALATTLVALASDATAQVPSGYLCKARQACPDPTSGAVVVFVHGVSGTSEGTWRSKAGVYWPDLVSAPGQDTATSNVYVHDYNSSWLGPSSSIGELARSSFEKWKLDGIFKHRTVVFVAHSLGGLVVNEALRLLTSDRPQTVLVLSVGVPWRGASPDRLNESVLRLATIRLATQFVARVVSEASTYAGTPVSGVEYTCLWERDPMGGVQYVVEKSSAIGLCPSPSRSWEVLFDHIDIAKPNSVADRQHVYLESEFRRLTVSKGQRMSAASFNYRSPGKRWDPDAIDRQTGRKGAYVDQSGGAGIFCGLVQTFKALENGRLSSIEFPAFNNASRSSVTLKLFRLENNDWSEKRQLLWAIPTPIGRKDDTTPIAIPINGQAELRAGDWYAFELYEDASNDFANANLYQETWGDFYEGRLYSKRRNPDSTCRPEWSEAPGRDVGFSVWVIR